MLRRAGPHTEAGHASATVPGMRRTKIVATIGPASREPETLVRLVEAGMDVARLNYSHGTLEEHAETVSARARRRRTRGAARSRSCRTCPGRSCASGRCTRTSSS